MSELKDQCLSVISAVCRVPVGHDGECTHSVPAGVVARETFAETVQSSSR